MALTDQPYLPLFVDDWMNNSKLKLCSPGAHGLMVSIMCLMHKSEQYGIILLKQKYKQTDKQILNFASQVAKQTSFDLLDVQSYLTELIDEKVLYLEGDHLTCFRMVKDAKTSLERSKSGKKGGAQTQKFAQAKDEAKPQANTGIESDNEIVIDNNLKESFEKKFETAFDEMTLESYRMQFPKLDLKAELSHFLLKCNSAKGEYHTRDPDGLRLGLLAQLKLSKSFVNGKSGNKKDDHTRSLLASITERHLGGNS